MSPVSDNAAQAAIGAAARELRLPTVRAQAARLAEIAAREHHTHLGYLAEVLAAELDDRSGRRRARRIADARFPPPPLASLAEALAADPDAPSGRPRARRIADARFPRLKRLADFSTDAV